MKGKGKGKTKEQSTGTVATPPMVSGMKTTFKKPTKKGGKKK